MRSPNYTKVWTIRVAYELSSQEFPYFSLGLLQTPRSEKKT